MTSHFTETLLFLAWLLVPVVAYFVYLLFKLFRRGKETEGESSEAET